VTWRYDAPGFEPGLLLTLLGVLLLAGLVGWALFGQPFPRAGRRESRLRTARERVPN
jgi:hypothetical protein